MTNITEITGMEGDAITMQALFRFRQTGVDEGGKVQGQFEAGGIRPRFSTRLEAQGITLGAGLFDPALGAEGRP